MRRKERRNIFANKPPFLWTLTPNYSAREGRKARLKTRGHPWHFRWTTKQSVWKRLSRNQGKQRDKRKEIKQTYQTEKGGNSDPAPPGNASIAPLTILTINFEPLRRTERLRVIMHHFGAFRERTAACLPYGLASFQCKEWVTPLKSRHSGLRLPFSYQVPTNCLLKWSLIWQTLTKNNS